MKLLPGQIMEFGSGCWNRFDNRGGFGHLPTDVKPPHFWVGDEELKRAESK